MLLCQLHELKSLDNNFYIRLVQSVLYAEGFTGQKEVQNSRCYSHC
jgi:hypothetical protein